MYRTCVLVGKSESKKGGGFIYTLDFFFTGIILDFLFLLLYDYYPSLHSDCISLVI